MIVRARSQSFPFPCLLCCLEQKLNLSACALGHPPPGPGPAKVTCASSGVCCARNRAKYIRTSELTTKLDLGYGAHLARLAHHLAQDVLGTAHSCSPEQRATARHAMHHPNDGGCHPTPTAQARPQWSAPVQLDVLWHQQWQRLLVYTGGVA